MFMTRSTGIRRPSTGRNDGRPLPPMNPLLEARGMEMQFPGVRALAGIDFTLLPGEVHALIGENGAGKSTLVKVLTGEVHGYEGSVLVDGVRRTFDSPRAALAAGIAVIPQELQLVRSLSVAENIFLGREPRGPAGLIDRTELTRRARAALETVGAGHLVPAALVGQLDAADRQMVAIARALSSQARILIMDEPTAALGRAEGERLEGIVRMLASRGAGVIYISHQLGEVGRLADRITVLRDGVRVTTIGRGAAEAEMVRLMVGREIESGELAPIPAGAAELLRVEGLSTPDPARPGAHRIRDVSFTVRVGEIVGFAGLVGAGRTDILLALVGGLPRPVTGTIVLDGFRYVPATPAEARDRGLVMLPEERKADGIFPRLGLDRNISISSLGRVSRAGWIDRAWERVVVDRLMADTGVKAASAAVPIETLSGGNQQKALLARCLFASPRVLLLDEPTRGIDLKAKAEIYRELRALAARGFGVVLCSSEMAEILGQCHRVVVFRQGQVVANFAHGEANEETVLAAAASAPAGPSASEPGHSGGPGGSGLPADGWRVRLMRHAGGFGLALVAILAVGFSPVRGGMPVFLDLGNLTDILRQVSEKGILAVGMTAVVISGGIDLSVGSVLALGATLTAWLLMKGGLGLAATALVVIAVSAAWGLLNGVVVARWRLPAFIATLATMGAARGAARFLSGGTAIPLGFGPGGAPESVHAIAAPLLPYLPAPALLFGIAALGVHLLLARTRSGRYLYAVGDNESAARLAGVRVAWHQGSVYVLAAVLAGLAGLIHCAQLEQGNPNDGVSYELDAIAAVVIGGTSLSGGVGSVGGTLIGILTIGIINNSMGLNNVDANLQLILKGIIIIAAVWLQRRRPA